MVSGLVIALIAVSAALAAWAGLAALLNRRPGILHLGGLALVEVMLLIQVVVALTHLLGGTRPDEVAVFLLYLLAVLFILPVGALWSLEERSRSSTLVLAVACIVVPIMAVRMQQLWQTAGG